MPLFFPLSLQLPTQDPLRTDVIGDVIVEGGALWSDAERAVVAMVV